METPYPKPINPNQTRIGWIGIGVMGQAMAARLISAGYSLTVYARTPQKASPLRQKGAIIVNSPSDVAEKRHPSDVRSVVLGDNGVLSGLSKGGVLIDTPSVVQLVVIQFLLKKLLQKPNQRVVSKLIQGVNGGEGKDAVVFPGAALSKQLFSTMVANGDGNMGTQGLITAIERINGKSV
ncbi:hypothetical protein MKW98_011140 [Papaver atlanticum]|uniref:6-phosphogluconate dehydrogenase NADP-binding domain-containing protein n=1 Tax=Papaver atlanticum TaxID=357466 RepID=A0AAD4XXQ5_9MAGN|nr:hypothetical protein MKW98_011140 [Papaver atlanticum]